MAASTPHSGDWLAVLPITPVSLRLSDEEVSVAVVHNLAAERVSLTNVHVARLLMHGVFTGWPAGGMHQDNNAIIW